MMKFRFGLAVLGLVSLLGSCKVNQPVSAPAQNNVAEAPAVAENLQKLLKEYRPSRTREHDLLHTRLDVRFDWEKQYLYGVATLELKPYFYPQRMLNLDAKGFELNSIELLQGEDVRPLDYTYDGNKINIDLGREFTKDEKLLVKIDYTAKPAERNIGTGEAIHSDQGLFFINHDGNDPEKPRQIWTQGETESSSCWFPTIDAPNERTTQEIYITVDSTYTTLSNGKLIYRQLGEDGQRTDYWKMDQPHAPYLFMMAVGDFAIVEDYYDSIPVNYYVEPEYEKYADDIFGNTPEMMEFFTKKLNYPYPWDKYAQVVVRDYVSGAMENTTASVFMEDLQVDSRQLLDYNWDDIIAHELFHQWFGDLVTCESWANLTLNEAFANYSEYLWREHKYGVEDADYHGMNELEDYLEEAKSKQVDLIRYYYEKKDDMFDSHSYAKGGRILHMLRKYVGDEAFFKSLEAYLKENKFEAVEVHDLRLAFEKVTGEDLNWFFNQWFLSSGHPVIKARHKYDSGKLKIEIWQQQDPAETPIYKLPIAIDFYFGDKKVRYDLMIEDLYQVFEMQFPSSPDLVIFDGKHQLLGEIDHLKTNEELRFQYSVADQFLPRYQAIDQLSKDLQDPENLSLVIDALNDDYWGIRNLAVNAFENYEGPHFDKVESKLMAMAINDDKSLVRADAIDVLSGIDNDKYLNLYKKGMNDSSYSVVGICLYAFANSSAVDKMDVFQGFEDGSNLNIVLPVADYYTQYQKYDKFEWFKGKVESMSGNDLWYVLQLFGEFLMEAPNYVQEEGADILVNFAKNNPTYYIRLAAYQSLGLLDSMEGIAKIREDIRANEKDSRLNQIYQNLP